MKILFTLLITSLFLSCENSKSEVSDNIEEIVLQRNRKLLNTQISHSGNIWILTIDTITHINYFECLTNRSSTTYKIHENGY